MMPPGEQDRAAGLAFDLEGGPDAVLLLHGFTGSPFEMRYLAERLCAAGLRCRGPVMAGHQDGPEVLARTPRREWIDAARRELLRLEGARRTFVAGCSMGALVALALAREQPDRVDGLALLSPALRLRPSGALAGFLARHTPLARLVPRIEKRAGSDVSDAEMRARNPCMTGIPLAGVAELQRLAREVDALLPSVAAPALVVAGARDHTVMVSGARRIAGRIGSGPARLVVLPRSWHLVGIDVERDRGAEVAAEFVAALPLPGRRRAPRRATRG